MNITKQVTDNISLINLGYKYKSQKFLGFISDDGVLRTVAVDPCMSKFPDTYSSVSIIPSVFTRVISGYFETCSVIDNPNKIRKYRNIG